MDFINSGVVAELFADRPAGIPADRARFEAEKRALQLEGSEVELADELIAQKRVWDILAKFDKSAALRICEWSLSRSHQHLSDP